MFLEHQETAGAGWVVSLNSAQNCFKTVLVQPGRQAFSAGFLSV